MDKTVPAGASMLLDYDVAMEVASNEALVRQAYRDGKNVLTWCVGMTNATGHRVERHIGKPAGLQHCMNVYVWALDNYAEGVRESFKDYRLTKARFAAALSFHWNTGAIKSATWVKHFKVGDMAPAKKAFLEWKEPGEIKQRRQKECDLLFDGKWSNDGTMTEFTRLLTNGRPDFKSGRRIHVENELRAAFATREIPIIDQAPQPDSIPARPTLSPSEAPDEGPLAKSKRFWRRLDEERMRQTRQGGQGMTDTAKRFDDLSPKTKDFLSNLRDEEVETLGDGIRLVNAIRTVGTFMKWVIVGFLGFVVGVVMLGESALKIMAWFRPPP